MYKYSNIKLLFLCAALSVYEAAGGGGGVELPKNGDEWHLLRDGGLRYLPSLSNDMNLLLQVL